MKCLKTLISVLKLQFFAMLSTDILQMANRSSHNDTEAEPDHESREKKLREVQAMLREMRYRSCVGQKKVADKEKTEAEKCKFIHSDSNTV